MRGYLSTIVAVVLMGLFAIPPPNASAWSAYVTLWQDTVTSGTNQTISITVTNDWVLDYTIEYVNVTIDWPGGPVNRSASGTPCQVSPGDPWAVVYFFDLNVLVPTPPSGTANYHVFVTLTADDHQNSTYSDTYVLIITVVPLEPPGTLEGSTFFFGLPLLICGGLVVALVVVLIVVLVVILVSRKRQQGVIMVMPQQDMRFKQ